MQVTGTRQACRWRGNHGMTRAGRLEAFRQLVGPFRRELQVHCGPVTGPSPTAIPGHGQPKDAMIIGSANDAIATTVFGNGHGPDGLADEQRQSAACPVTGQEAPHDK